MPQPVKALSHIGVYVYRSGTFGDKARPLDKECEKRAHGGPRDSRDLAVQSVPSKQSRVRLITQLEEKKSMRETTRPTITRSRSPSPAATQMFFC